jgi:hypothetical protein
MKSSFVINSSNPPDMLIDLLLNNKLIDGLPEHASSTLFVCPFNLSLGLYSYCHMEMALVHKFD